METWVRRCASFEEEHQADVEFWARLTPDERVAAVESLRQHWFKMTGQRDEGLRRTVRVLEGPER